MIKEVVDLNLPLNRQAEIIAFEIRKEAQHAKQMSQFRLEQTGHATHTEGLHVKV